MNWQNLVYDNMRDMLVYSAQGSGAIWSICILSLSEKWGLKNMQSTYRTSFWMLSISEQWEDFGNSHRLQGKEDFRWKEYCDFTVVCNGSILVYENYPQKGKKNKNSNYVKEKLNSATVGAGYCSCMRRWRLCPRHSSPLWDTEQDLSQNLEHVGEQAFQEEITEMKPLSKLALGMQMGWLSSSVWSLGICRMSAGNSDWWWSETTCDRVHNTFYSCFPFRTWTGHCPHLSTSSPHFHIAREEGSSVN